mmetsp:Transcript_7134/g.9878  ORF Transcript_7134/g.9878 Transcript_7134/m.9878 type:complete len:116 (-) Transcript_7134:318-665(-)
MVRGSFSGAKQSCRETIFLSNFKPYRLPSISGPICNGTYSVEAIEDAFGSSLAVKHIFTLKHSIPFLTTIFLTALERTQLLEQLQESQRHQNKCIPVELFRIKVSQKNCDRDCHR